jgi:hypothetical protein
LIPLFTHLSFRWRVPLIFFAFCQDFLLRSIPEEDHKTNCCRFTYKIMIGCFPLIIISWILFLAGQRTDGFATGDVDTEHIRSCWPHSWRAGDSSFSHVDECQFIQPDVLTSPTVVCFFLSN